MMDTFVKCVECEDEVSEEMSVPVIVNLFNGEKREGYMCLQCQQHFKDGGY